MGRVLIDPDRDLLCGMPEPWRIVLDEMTADDSLKTIDSAISSFIDRELAGEDERQAAEQYALTALLPWAALTSYGATEEVRPPIPLHVERAIAPPFNPPLPGFAPVGQAAPSGDCIKILLHGAATRPDMALRRHDPEVSCHFSCPWFDDTQLRRGSSTFGGKRTACDRNRLATR